ncbi:unnamed protein product [Euphydryas editha]|uniref:Endonuclease/exonuclease/phosphatase domain-containing protein n=1 Tax=Euphydryas editha TaxID=104508 RepID=A0AAU9TI28_EUPED|nr:unnamed protein product [Euphydryas editha]
MPARLCSATVDLHICVVYVPPDPRRIPFHTDTIISMTRSVIDNNPNDNYLIIGDFNLPCVSWDDRGPMFLKRGSVEIQNASMNLIESFEYFGLKQYNLQKNYAGNTLDLVFSNLSLSIDHCSTALVGVDRAHPPFTVNIADLFIVPLQESNTPRHNFRKADYEKINAHLISLNWNSLLHRKTVDESVDVLYTVIHDCIDQYVPLRFNRSAKRTYPKWYSPALIKIVKEKDKAHKRWKRYKNKLDYDEFSTLRARERKVQKQCFANFTKSSEENIKTHPKIFWSFIKGMRCESKYPKSMSLGNVKFRDGKEICDGFNAFFKGVFGNSDNSSITSVCDGNSMGTNTLSSIQTSTETVKKLLLKLDTNKGAGSDGIPPYFGQSAQTLSHFH